MKNASDRHYNAAKPPRKMKMLTTNSAIRLLFVIRHGYRRVAQTASLTFSQGGSGRQGPKAWQ